MSNYGRSSKFSRSACKHKGRNDVVKSGYRQYDFKRTAVYSECKCEINEIKQIKLCFTNHVNLCSTESIKSRQKLKQKAIYYHSINQFVSFSSFAHEIGK